MLKDMHHDIQASTALEAQVIDSDTTTEGETIDTQGFGSTEFLFTAGELADGVFTAALMESDDVDELGVITGETAVNLVEGADDLIGELPVLDESDDGSGATKKVGYKGSKRYLRFDVVSTGTTDGGIIGCTVAQGDARNNPVE